MHILPQGIQILIFFSLGLPNGINNITPFPGPTAEHNPNRQQKQAQDCIRTYLDNSKRNHERENEENSTDLADLAQAHAEHS